MARILHDPPRPFRSEVDQHDVKLAAGAARALWFHGGSTDPTRAVLCIAGMGANGRSFVRQRPLSDSRLLLLLNLPFHTPRGEDPVAFAARAVEELIDRLALDRPVLLGSSFGGTVAARVALRLQEKLLGLVLVSAVLSGRQIPLATPAFVDLLEAPEPLARLVSPLAVQIMGGFGLDRDARDEIVREARVFRSSELKRRLLSLMGQELLPGLSALRVPTLVVHGSRDWLVPAARGRWSAQAIPGARFQLIRGAGHLPYLSHPEPFNAALGEFLGHLDSLAASFFLAK